MATPIGKGKRRTKRTYLGSGAGSMRSGTGTTAKAKSKKTNRPYSGVLPSDKPSARKKTKSTQTKATELLKKSLITPKVIKAFKNPSTQKAIKTAVNKAIKSSPPGAVSKGVKAASKVIKKRTKPTARTMRKKAKR